MPRHAPGSRSARRRVPVGAPATRRCAAIFNFPLPPGDPRIKFIGGLRGDRALNARGIERGARICDARIGIQYLPRDQGSRQIGSVGISAALDIWQTHIMAAVPKALFILFLLRRLRA